MGRPFKTNVIKLHPKLDSQDKPLVHKSVRLDKNGNYIRDMHGGAMLNQRRNRNANAKDKSGTVDWNAMDPGDKWGGYEGGDHGGAGDETTGGGLTGNGEDTTVFRHYFQATGATHHKLDQPRMKAVDAWRPYWKDYLAGLYRLDGRRSDEQKCSHCKKTGQIHRCLDCFGMMECCGECMVSMHPHNPLHRIQLWTGLFWLRSSLRALGLQIQLGHGGSPCDFGTNPRKLHVYHLNGYHDVDVAFCGCSKAVQRHQQLLDHAWFSASLKDPQTVFTFDTLDFYSSLSSQGRASAQDYYDALVLFSDASKLAEVPKRYDEFLTGSLAVECPLCPLEGKNIPANYREASEGVAFKHTLILAEDANMKLKGKDPKGRPDPSLESGSAFFVPDAEYQRELANPQHAKNVGRDVSDCPSNIKAFDQQETKFNKGYTITGVGGIVCARHGLVLPNGIGDLQRGERYVNMDFVFLSAMSGRAPARVIASYDIACRWFYNLPARMADFPTRLHIDLTRIGIRPAIPKLHLPGHGPKCQAPYSFNYLKGVGRTCGEAVERFWSSSNPAAPSTREMTPGHRQDHLNSIWSHMNWRKITGASSFLMRKLLEAFNNREKQRESFASYTDAFTPQKIQGWESIYNTWEEKPFETPSPFAYPYEASSLKQRLKELREQEEQELREENRLSNKLIGGVTTAEFVSQGMDLEYQISKLLELEADDVADYGSLTLEVKNKRRALLPRIAKWSSLQASYMPQLALHIPSLKPDDNDAALRLHLPSSLPAAVRLLVCPEKLVYTELELRVAQADAQLEQLRKHLRYRTRGFQFKRANISGQRPSTRMHAALGKVTKKAKSAATSYRRAREALIALDPTVETDTKHPYARFQQLLESHIAGPMGEVEDTVNSQGNSKKKNKTRSATGEGKRVHSWIWNMRTISEDCTEVDDSDLRVEWCRSKARLARWEEEVILVVEEMRRMLAYSTWKSKWWISESAAIEVDPSSGYSSYAKRQSAMWLRLARECETKWTAVLREKGYLGDLTDEIKELQTLITDLGSLWTIKSIKPTASVIGISTSSVVASMDIDSPSTNPSSSPSSEVGVMDVDGGPSRSQIFRVAEDGSIHSTCLS